MNLRTKQILVVLAIIIAVILFLIALFYTGNNLRVKMARLEGANMEISKQNKQLSDSILSQTSRIESLNKVIEQQTAIEERLKQATERINTQINQLNKKYEAANNFTVNYNADSIRRYFSKFNSFSY